MSTKIPSNRSGLDTIEARAVDEYLVQFKKGKHLMLDCVQGLVHNDLVVYNHRYRTVFVVIYNTPEELFVECAVVGKVCD